MSCSICLEGFCADPEANYVFLFGKQWTVFWGSSQKVTSWISVAWVRFNLWMAYLYHRLILRCEIQSLNSDVQSNHGFGISYILWSTYIYLADSMAIQGRCTVYQHTYQKWFVFSTCLKFPGLQSGLLPGVIVDHRGTDNPPRMLPCQHAFHTDHGCWWRCFWEQNRWKRMEIFWMGLSSFFFGKYDPALFLRFHGWNLPIF